MSKWRSIKDDVQLEGGAKMEVLRLALIIDLER